MKMKSLLLFCTIFFCSHFLKAQTCEGFFPFEQDTEMEMTYYDKKGKVSTINQIVVEDIFEEEEGTEVQVATTVKDKKGEEVFSGKYTIKCVEDGYEVDVSNIINPALLKSAYGMELEVDGDAMVFPENLKIGQTLPDASATIDAMSNDIKIMSFKFDITDRKVESKEEVTTPAGTFECYKISYNFNSKILIAKKKYRIVQWVSKDVGLVKEETYNKKGKLDSSAELTKFKKGS